jgi:hypothetical protein
MSSSLPGVYNLTVYRGDTFNLDCAFNTATAWDAFGNPTSWTPVNMTGGTLQAEVRDSTQEAATLLETFNITNLVAASGSFTLNLTPSQTNGVAWTQGYWDLQYTDAGGNVQTLMYGTVTIEDDVTHA